MQKPGTLAAALAILLLGTFVTCGRGPADTEDEISSTEEKDKSMIEHKHTNQLINETSPYLIQHAHNPVDWYPWGEEALTRAKKEDKPIFLSIGYSACHWCHVMERESFENEEIAKIMNENFINIKVDREERPDLDEVYMDAVNLMTGRGGWPMSVFLTPDLKPFFGGTYFPPEDRLGMVGFRTVLARVAEIYRDQRDEVEQQSSRLVEHLGQVSKMSAGEGELGRELIDQAASQLQSRFDPQDGGFGPAPKFPQSMGMSLLLRQYRNTGDETFLQMVEVTLTKMASGGIYDQLGGGFHRYSTDARWLVPHFEKMLYDNALLTKSYLETYQVTGKPFYREVARETLDYVLREMTGPDGGFYSTQDADSEGEEGKFFVWTHDEVKEILGEEDARVISRYYGIEENGNWEEEKNILHVDTPPETVAKLLGISQEELVKTVETGSEKLFAVREKRIRPGLDDKVLTAWNGMMISSMVDGHQVIGDERYLEAAVNSAEFILKELAKDGRLLRTHRAGKSHLTGYLNDYAYFIAGLIDLYEATFDLRWLEEALRFNDTLIEHFWDDEGGAFFFTADDHEKMIIRSKNPQDNAIPSGNSIEVMNLLRLAELTSRTELKEKAVETLKAITPIAQRYPAGFAELLCGLDFFLDTPKEIVIASNTGPGSVGEILGTVHSKFIPNKVLAFAGGQQSGSDLIPMLEGKIAQNGRPTVYVCENYTCKRPVTTVEELDALLK